WTSGKPTSGLVDFVVPLFRTRTRKRIVSPSSSRGVTASSSSFAPTAVSFVQDEDYVALPVVASSWKRGMRKRRGVTTSLSTSQLFPRNSVQLPAGTQKKTSFIPYTA
ncbi:unnamed protein product, partial [Amoebophrya sp. A25]